MDSKIDTVGCDFQSDLALVKILKDGLDFFSGGWWPMHILKKRIHFLLGGRFIVSTESIHLKLQSFQTAKIFEGFDDLAFLNRLFGQEPLVGKIQKLFFEFFPSRIVDISGLMDLFAPTLAPWFMRRLLDRIGAATRVDLPGIIVCDFGNGFWFLWLMFFRRVVFGHFFSDGGSSR